MKGKRKEYSSLVGKQKETIDRPRCRWENNIKMVLTYSFSVYDIKREVELQIITFNKTF
jgi:hypothetical protein